MKHTPGPWVAVTLDSEKDPVEVHRRMLSFGQGPVFLVHAPEHPDATADFAIFVATVGNGPTSSKNARLIATAPELLEALKGEATEVDGRLCWCTQPNMIKYRGHDSGCESNRELVAKATGEGAR